MSIVFDGAAFQKAGRKTKHFHVDVHPFDLLLTNTFWLNVSLTVFSSLLNIVKTTQHFWYLETFLSLLLIIKTEIKQQNWLTLQPYENKVFQSLNKICTKKDDEHYDVDTWTLMVRNKPS